MFTIIRSHITVPSIPPNMNKEHSHMSLNLRHLGVEATIQETFVFGEARVNK